MNTLQAERRLALFVGGRQFHPGRVGQKGPHDHPRFGAQRVHPQQFMGRALFDFNKSLEFCLGQEHGADNLAENDRIAPGKWPALVTGQ